VNHGLRCVQFCIVSIRLALTFQLRRSDSCSQFSFVSCPPHLFQDVSFQLVAQPREPLHFVVLLRSHSSGISNRSSKERNVHFDYSQNVEIQGARPSVASPCSFFGPQYVVDNAQPYGALVVSRPSRPIQRQLTCAAGAFHVSEVLWRRPFNLNFITLDVTGATMKSCEIAGMSINRQIREPRRRRGCS